MKNEFEFRLHPAFLWACLAISVFLRLAFPDLIEFKSDEFAGIQLAHDSIHNTFALTGMRSSIGLHNPPFFIYLLSIPVLFTTDPVYVTYFVIALNLAALGLLYCLLGRLFSKNTALIILVLFATGPWGILYSRKIWAQDCLLLFVVLFYIVLASQLQQYRRWNIYLLAVLLALITQLHMSAWPLPFVLIAFLLLFRIRVDARDAIIGMLLILAVYSPYIYFLADGNVLSMLLSGGSPGPVCDPPGSEWYYVAHCALSPAWKNGGWSFIITGGAGFHYVLGKSGLQAMFEAYPVKYLYPLFTVYYLFAAGGLIYATRFAWKKLEVFRQGRALAPWEQMLILFVFVYLGIQGAYFLFGVPAYPHYGIVFYPILTIFCVIFFKACFARGNLWVKRGLTAALALIMVGNLLFTGAFFMFIRYYPEKITGDYGPPYFLTAEDWKRKLP